MNTQQNLISLLPNNREGEEPTGSFTAREAYTTSDSKKSITLVESPERLAAAIDAVGRLQNEYNVLGARLAKLKEGLCEVLPAGLTRLEGSDFVAIGTETPVDTLRQTAQIHTLLAKMLVTLDDKEANRGGLFDMILKLDPAFVNTHFVPLLKEVFKQSGQSSDAEVLFLTESQRHIEFVKKD